MSLKSRLVLIAFVSLVLLPLIVILVWMWIERYPWPNIFPKVFSRRAIDEILKNSGNLSAIMLSSVGLSLLVAFLSVFIAFLSAKAINCFEFFGKKAVKFLVIFPLMIPTTVIAMGIQMRLIRIGINNTAYGVVLSHLIPTLPYAVIMLSDAMQVMGNRYEEQAKMLGASPVHSLFRVSLPLLSPVLLPAFAMAYVVSFSQYFLSLIIGGGKVKTFAIVMVPFLQSGNRNMASAYSVIFIGITLIVFMGLNSVSKRLVKIYGSNFFGE